MPKTSSATRRRRPRFDLEFRPKSYWPPRSRKREIDIVRIEVSSSSRDVIRLTARGLSDGRIHYRMIHEDANGRTRHRIRAKPASSTQPLAMGELIALLEHACYTDPCQDEGDDERYGGVIWGTLRLSLEHGADHADDYLFMLTIASDHYPKLEAYYRGRVNDWCLANCVEEDCGKVVRLRTGRFPRKLVAPG